MKLPLYALAVLALAFVGSCGAPQPHDTAPQVEAATGVAQCKVVKDTQRPMLVEWPAVEKAGLQSNAARGVVVVRYDGCRLKRLDQCTVQGSYGFTETSRAKDGFTIRNKSELFAKLPLGAISLEGELLRGNALELAYVAVGTRDAQVSTVSRDKMPAGCEGATHFVRSMVVGAYELSSEFTVGGGAALEVGNVGAGGAAENQRAVIRSDGDLAACVETSTPADSQQCLAVVQLVLEPISEAVAPVAPLPEAPAQPGAPASSAQPAGDTFLFVRLEEDVPDATLFLNESQAGPVPWRGPVNPGRHIVKVVAPGMREIEEIVDVPSGTTEIVEYKLRPADKLETGIFYIGVLYEYAIGAGWVADEPGQGAYFAAGPQLNLGFHIFEDPVWYELGVRVNAGLLAVPDNSGSADSYQVGPSFGLLSRLLFGLKRPWIYWVIEAEPGVDAGGITGVSLALRGGLSFFANDWFEFRVNPLGLRVAQHFNVTVNCDVSSSSVCDGDEAEKAIDVPFVLYDLSVGVVLRL